MVLLGGGEPGFHESREIARAYDIPVTSCAHSQMHIATTLGNKFSVIDMAENHSSYYLDLVIQHRFDRHCASIRNLQLPHPRPGYDDLHLAEQKQKALRGEKSEMVEAAVVEAVAAIEAETGLVADDHREAARIAERLRQSGPTVSQTVARMERDGLVRVGGDRQLDLTDEGRRLAVQVMRRHRLAECLLIDVIGMPWEDVGSSPRSSASHRVMLLAGTPGPGDLCARA